jgi:hypothetical protein
MILEVMTLADSHSILSILSFRAFILASEHGPSGISMGISISISISVGVWNLSLKNSAHCALTASLGRDEFLCIKTKRDMNREEIVARPLSFNQQ